MDQIELDDLIGQVTVFDLGILNPLSQITAIDLQKCADENKHSSRLFIKTGWGSRYGNAEFFNEFPSLTQDAIVWLVENKIKLIGVEQPSLNINEDLKIHQILLDAGIICIENLANMEQVSAGNYNMAALPLKLFGLDGAPVRVIITDSFL